MPNIGDRIRTIRSELGLSQDGFAQKLDVTKNTIGNWELAKVGVGEKEIALMAQTFGVSADWLRTGEGDMHAPEDTSALEREALCALVAVLPNGVAMLDTDLRYLAWNDEYLRQWDIDPDSDIRGLSMYEVFPDVSPEGRIRLDRVLRGESVRLGEPEPYHWKRADGRVYWSRLRMFPWRYETGEIGGIIVTASASLNLDSVPHLDGRLPQEKMPTPIDEGITRGYNPGAHQPSDEEMSIPQEWLISAAAAAIAITMDPDAMRDMARRMAGRKGFRLKVSLEPDDTKPAPGEGTT